MKSNVEEIRNIKGKLVAKWYPDEGVIEIIGSGCYTLISILSDVQIQVESDRLQKVTTK